MSFFDKIPFLRKKSPIENINLGLGDETALPRDASPPDTGFPPEQNYSQPYGQPSYGTFRERPSALRMEPMQDQQAYLLGKNMEVLNAKLDTLKATLDSISQRMANIESMLWEQRRRY